MNLNCHLPLLLSQELQIGASYSKLILKGEDTQTYLCSKMTLELIATCVPQNKRLGGQPGFGFVARKRAHYEPQGFSPKGLRHLSAGGVCVENRRYAAICEPESSCVNGQTIPPPKDPPRPEQISPSK